MTASSKISGDDFNFTMVQEDHKQVNNPTDGLPIGWTTASLEAVTEIRDDLRKPINAYERTKRSGPYPYYGATGQVGWIDDFLMDGEYVLLGEDGAPFLDPAKPKAYIVNGKSWVNNHAHVLQGKHGILNSRYLMYLLNATDYRSFVNGTTRLKLTQGAMRTIPVPLPPVHEQEGIVAEIEKQFSRLDVAVTALKRVQTNLKRYRAAVLRAACEGRLVQTEAELARKEGRDYEPADVLLQRILSERRARWEPEQLAKLQAQGRLPLNDTWKAKYQEPEIPDTTNLLKLPEGWSWTSLGQVAEVQGGIQKQPSRAPKENIYPFLRVANVLRGRLDLSEVHGIELFNGELAKLRLYPDDLLIVEGNGSPSEIGRMAIWHGAILDCVHQNHIIRARPLRVRSKYVETYWNSPEGSRNVLNQASSTTGLHTLSVSKVNRLPIPLPPLAEQKRIVAEVERRLSILDKVAASVAADLKRAERLRQAILQRAFAGKLVPQDPADEPASVLLERIRAERAASEKPIPQKTNRTPLTPRQMTLDVVE